MPPGGVAAQSPAPPVVALGEGAAPDKTSFLQQLGCCCCGHSVVSGAAGRALTAVHYACRGFPGVIAEEAAQRAKAQAACDAMGSR